MYSQYKRTCKACGKVWYSLKSREDELKSKVGCCGGCGNTCYTCGDKSAEFQAERNKDATESEIAKLQKCPDCHSGVYRQEIENFYK